MTDNRKAAEAAIERRALRWATQGPGRLQDIREVLPERMPAWTDGREAIWVALLAEYQTAGRLTPDTLRARVALIKPQMVPELETILALDERVENTDAMKLADIAARRWLRQKLASAVDATATDTEINELLRGLRRVADIAETGGVNRDYANDHTQYEELVEWARTKPEAAVKVVLDEIAQHVPSFNEGTVNVIAGETGTGKTTLMLQLCLMALLQGIRTAYLPTETDGKGTRIMIGSPVFGYQKDRALDQDEMYHCPDFREWVLGCQLAILQRWGSSDGVSLDGLLATDERSSYTQQQALDAIRFYGKRGYRAVFFDHIHRIKFLGPEKEYIKIENFIKDLNDIAKQYRLTVFIGAQVNRREYEAFGPPSIKSLRGSQSIAEETTRTFMVYRPSIAVLRDKQTGEDYIPNSRAHYIYIDSAADLKAARESMPKEKRETHNLVAVPAPGIFAFEIAKDRVKGVNTGRRVLLHYDWPTNRLFDPAPDGQHKWFLAEHTKDWKPVMPDGDPIPTIEPHGYRADDYEQAELLDDAA